MYLVQHMSSPPVTVQADAPIPAVQDILRSRHFRHMPVVDETGHLLGIVTDRDLRSAYPSSFLSDADRKAALDRLAETPVSAIMTCDSVSVPFTGTLDDALFLLDRHRVGALPVVNDKGIVVGMFSIRDLMRAYKKLFGLGERGSALIEIEDDGQPKLLTRIVQALEERKIPFTRLVRTTADETGTKRGVVYVRVHTYNIHGVREALRAADLRISR